tara:strand:- start:2390 stop:2920 length:531 start_codon:yes stop_codon:yes gene_type:complete
MQEYGRLLLEVSRGKSLKWKRVLFSLLMISLLFAAFTRYYSNVPIAFSIALCVMPFLYIAIKELTLDRKTAILIIFEKGIKSELLKPSGSDFISWHDIKKIELAERTEPYYAGKCTYLELIPKNETKYKKGLGETWVFGQNEYGYNTMSFNISHGLDVDPEYLYSVCLSAHESAKI